MPEIDAIKDQDAAATLGGRAMLLAFGLGVLAFLVVADRAEWFSIRPATGTSVAMARAADGGADRNQDAGMQPAR